MAGSSVVDSNFCFEPHKSLKPKQTLWDEIRWSESGQDWFRRPQSPLGKKLKLKIKNHSPIAPSAGGYIDTGIGIVVILPLLIRI